MRGDACPPPRRARKRCRRADRELIEELRRYARGEAYDAQAMPELDSDALDFRAASESFAPVRKLERRDLETLGLMTTHQGRKVPTVGGILLFGRDRERQFPDAWIQAGRFRGTDRAHIADSAEIRLLPTQAVEAAIAFVEKHALHGAEIARVRRQERWNLPPVSVREAIVNAVAHADYAQRGAPIRVAMRRAVLAGTTVGSPLLPLAKKADKRTSSNISKSLLDAGPSVPMPTLSPASSILTTGAKPEASLRFEDGLCDTPAPA